MTGIQPGQGLLKSGKKKTKKKRIEFSPLKHTLKYNEGITVNSQGRTLYQPYSECVSIEITQFISVGEYTGDNSGSRHQTRWLLHGL